MADLPPDVIRIRGLRLPCVLGVYEEERKAPRPVVLDIELVADTSAAALSDNLAETIDYHALRNDIATAVCPPVPGFLLLERLAATVCDLCLRDPRVLRATVRAGKPGAVPDAETAEVEITRYQGDAIL